MAETRRPIPLNPEPSERGNVVFVSPNTWDVTVLGAEAARAARAEGRQLFMPHHATCPEVGQFRKGKK